MTNACHFMQLQPRDFLSDNKIMNSSYVTWKCLLCDFIYDEAIGLPAEGFPPGTRWSDIPDSWSCPECGFAKSDFEMVPVA